MLQNGQSGRPDPTRVNLLFVGIGPLSAKTITNLVYKTSALTTRLRVKALG